MSVTGKKPDQLEILIGNKTHIFCNSGCCNRKPEQILSRTSNLPKENRNYSPREGELEQQVKKIEKLEERVDDCEQYSRRLCVRIDNMAVPSGVKEDCLSKLLS